MAEEVHRYGRIKIKQKQTPPSQVYKHINNTDGIDDRQVHPLAGTSVGDMMDEFSSFNWDIIIYGYLLMVNKT
jgi:hypothetical protein